MTGIDQLASQLLEESKRFLEKARDPASDEAARDAFLHSSLSLAFSSLEAHINSMAEDQLLRTDLTPHERGILSEKRVELQNGRFEVLSGLQMYRVEDRLQFLWTRCSTAPPFDRNLPVWGQLKDSLRLRNGLTHPKEMVTVTVEAVERCLRAIIEIIDIAYLRIYKRAFPAKSKDLHSSMTF